MIAAGFTIGGIAYLTTSMAGALAIDRARDFQGDPLTDDDESRRGDARRRFGRALLIPGVGPFIAIRRADTALRAWGAGVSGVAQGVAIGLTIAGFVRRARALPPRRVAWAPTAGPEGAGLELALRF